MRILKVSEVFHPYVHKGGPAVKVRAVAEHLAARGHDVTVVSIDRGPRAPESTPYRAVYLKPLLRYRTNTVTPAIIPFAAGRVADFDVAHVYGLYEMIGPVVAAYCRRRGIPYVVEPMGMFRPIVRSVWKKRLYHRLFGHRLIAGAARVIATADREREELIAGGVDPARVVVRRNGVDLSEFASLPARGAFRAAAGIDAADPLLLYLGRISWKKGLHLLLRALATLDLPRVRLAVVGPDDGDGSLPALRRLAGDLGLADRVAFPGPVYGRDKLAALVDADLFVLPSQNENFGNSAAEAVAAGTPVLVTDQCGIAPLVDRRAGEAVEFDENALRAGLSRLLKNDSLLRHYKMGCPDVAARLTWDEPIDLLQSIYAEIRNASKA